jgi:hypothetical protein
LRVIVETKQIPTWQLRRPLFSRVEKRGKDTPKEKCLLRKPLWLHPANGTLSRPGEASSPAQRALIESVGSISPAAAPLVFIISRQYKVDLHNILAFYQHTTERQRGQQRKPFRPLPVTPGNRNCRGSKPSTQQKEKARRFQRGLFLFGATLFVTFSRARERK